MPISGLVITLVEDSQLAASAVTHLSTRPEITVGTCNERWLPVAVEARDEAHSRTLHDWIAAQVGVSYVDVVSVNFEEDSNHSSVRNENPARSRTFPILP